MDIDSLLMSIGVSPSSTVDTTGGCTQVVGNAVGIIGMADDVVLGIRVATEDSPLPGKGESDGSITDIGAIIEFDCDDVAFEVVKVDSKLRSSSLAKSSSSLV